MNNINSILEDLISRKWDEDWYEFKDNWYSASGIGEYISALSNAAALAHQDNGYLIWGVHDKTHNLTDSQFDWHQNVDQEPLEHYLARQITPDVNFSFQELSIQGKRLVVLTVPAAKTVPTAFAGVRYLRIGSSKVNLSKFPKREANLFSVLNKGFPTIENTESQTQDLTFDQLFLYYSKAGIPLNPATFKENLGLLTPDGKYNLLAQLLSDNSFIPVRVAFFAGPTKGSRLSSVMEFGYTCLLSTMDQLLMLDQVVNLQMVVSSGNEAQRQEESLFNRTAFREAVLNAVVHNSWITQSGPVISVFTDHIEIQSVGSLPPEQTREGYFHGVSIPVNRKLADIFLQLRYSERVGQGVLKIVEACGKQSCQIGENYVCVSIPFKSLFSELKNDGSMMVAESGSSGWGKVSDYTPPEIIHSSESDNADLERQVINEIEQNPSVTYKYLAEKLQSNNAALRKIIKNLQDTGILVRHGTNRKGTWEVLHKK